MTISAEKKAMLKVFEQKAAPTLFLSSMFKTRQKDVFNSEKCVIDVKRGKELIAIDVIPGTGGHLNNNKKFSTKEYTPPVYDIYTTYTGTELQNRLPGDDPFKQTNYLENLLAVVTDDQASNWDMILRAIEWQASQALFAGQIPLINSDTIDFKQKATHQHDASAKWNTSSGVPYVDLEACADLIRKDGKAVMSNLIFGSTAWTDFMSNDEALKKFNYRRVDIVDIKTPLLNPEGAAFHGIISVGSYTVRCWTYPQFYDVPSDADIGVASGTITNSGSLGLPYVPATKVLCLGQNIDLRLVYAGLPVLVGQKDPRIKGLGLSSMPAIGRTKRQPYALVDEKARSIISGVRSAPLCVPTQIDGYVVLETNP